MKKTIPALILPDIDKIILTVRDQKVILDTDLAGIYGVPTFRFNEAVRRNIHRFPVDFMFPLTREEWVKLESLRSQFAMLKPGRGQHRKYLPHAFTEHGSLMAANILKSPRAVEMSLYVIRAFVKLRSEFARSQDMARRLAEIEKTLIGHDGALRDLYNKIRPLLAPPRSETGRNRFSHCEEIISRIR